MRDVKVGSVVYPHYKPAKVGVVIKIEHKPWEGGTLAVQHSYNELTIKRPNGLIYSIKELGVSDFESLVEDHKHKAEKHADTLAKCKALSLE